MILSIDQARVSGWAVISPDRKVMEHGVARTYLERRAAVESAMGYPLLAVVLEEHYKSCGRMSSMSVLGMGESRGRWMEALAAAGVPAARISRVTPTDWRRCLFGKARGKDSAAWKREAQAWCRTMHRLDVGPDEADAICMGCAAWTLPNVQAIVSKRVLNPRVKGSKP